MTDDFVILKTEDGKYILKAGHDYTQGEYLLNNFEQIYNRVAKQNQNPKCDLLFKTLAEYGFNFYIAYREAQYIYYECEATGNTWAYNKKTGKWTRIIKNV